MAYIWGYTEQDTFFLVFSINPFQWDRVVVVGIGLENPNQLIGKVQR